MPFLKSLRQTVTAVYFSTVSVKKVATHDCPVHVACSTLIVHSGNVTYKKRRRAHLRQGLTRCSTCRDAPGYPPSRQQQHKALDPQAPSVIHRLDSLPRPAPAVFTSCSGAARGAIRSAAAVSSQALSLLRAQHGWADWRLLSEYCNDSPVSGALTQAHNIRQLFNAGCVLRRTH